MLVSLTLLNEIHGQFIIFLEDIIQHFVNFIPGDREDSMDAAQAATKKDF